MFLLITELFYNVLFENTCFWKDKVLNDQRITFQVQVFYSSYTESGNFRFLKREDVTTGLSCYATRFSSGLMFLLFLLLSLRISLVVYSEFVQVERSNNIHATFEMVSTLPPIYHQHSNFWLNLNCQNTSCDICKIFKNNNHSCHVASNRAINSNSKQ